MFSSSAWATLICIDPEDLRWLWLVEELARNSRSEMEDSETFVQSAPNLRGYSISEAEVAVG